MLLAGLLLALGLAAPSTAATRTVRLTNDGPVPASLTIKAGDRVVFVNADTVPHQVRSQGSWQYDSGPVPPGQTSAPTPALSAPGTYRYADVRGIVLLPQTFAGSLVVPKPAPSPTPSRTASPSPTASASASPSASPRPSATSSTAQPSPTPAPTGTRSPTPAPTASGGVPTPAPSSPGPTPAPDVRYGDPQALVQSSPHRYGLPALLAGVLAGGVLSLLVRVLLWLPQGRPAR